MSIRKMLADLHPSLKLKYNSEQYKLAQDIITKKLELKVSQPILAFLMGISYDKYLDMESGSIDIPVEDYKLALAKVQDLNRNKIIPEINELVSKYPSFVVKKIQEPELEQIVYNIKPESLDNLNLDLSSNKQSGLVITAKNTLTKKLMGKDFRYIKEPKSDNRLLNAGKMSNSAYIKGIENSSKYSFEFEDDYNGETPITA